jgi:hypothetical protein
VTSVRSVAFLPLVWYERRSNQMWDSPSNLLVTTRGACERLFLLSLTYTSGFDPAALLDHFQKHSGRMQNVATPSDYEARADALFVTPRPTDILECTRLDGDVVRFNPRTDEYGVVGPGLIIRTYYVPVPCRTLAPQNRLPGKCHHAPTNLAYFKRNCKRTYVIN